MDMVDGDPAVHADCNNRLCVWDCPIVGVQNFLVPEWSLCETNCRVKVYLKCPPPHHQPDLVQHHSVPMPVSY